MKYKIAKPKIMDITDDNGIGGAMQCAYCPACEAYEDLGLGQGVEQLNHKTNCPWNNMKKYSTHNDDLHINTNGSYFQGDLNISYDRLVELFGHPTEGDCYKTDAEWIIQFENGTIATIYNYKNGRNYMGALSKEEITEWHIGGFNKKAVKLVNEIIGNNQ